MVNGICFDLDGVILDYKHRFYQTYKDILKKEGITCPEKEYLYRLRRNYNLNQHALLDKFLIPKNLPDREKIIQRCIEKRNSILESLKYLKLDRFFPGAIKTLKYLKKDYILGLITKRKDKKTAKEQLKDVITLFDFVRIGNPKKSSLIEFCKKFHLEACYFLTDSSEDILEGKKAGIIAIAVDSGIENIKTMSKSLPHITINNINDILKIVK